MKNQKQLIQDNIKSKNSFGEWTLNNVDEYERNLSSFLYDNSSSIDQRQSIKILNINKANGSSFSYDQNTWQLLPIMEQTKNEQHRIFKKAIQKLQICVSNKQKQKVDKATSNREYDDHIHYPPELIQPKKPVAIRRRSEQKCPVSVINILPQSDSQRLSEEFLSYNPSPKQNLKQKLFNEGQFQLLCSKLGMDQTSRTKVNTPLTERRSGFKNLEHDIKLHKNQNNSNDLVLLKLKQERQIQSSIQRNINNFFQQKNTCGTTLKLIHERTVTQSNHIPTNENQEKRPIFHLINNTKQIDLFNDKEKSTQKKMKLKRCRIKQFTLKDISLPESNRYQFPLRQFTKVSRLNQKIPLKF